MFEDFRKQIDDSAFSNEDQEEALPVEIIDERHFLGMTPVQRFIVAILLLLMTIILGTLFLLVTSKIAPPFFS
jgi:hypothetical protein